MANLIGSSESEEVFGVSPLAGTMRASEISLNRLKQVRLASLARKESMAAVRKNSIAWQPTRTQSVHRSSRQKFSTDISTHTATPKSSDALKAPGVRRSVAWQPPMRKGPNPHPYR